MASNWARIFGNVGGTNPPATMNTGLILGWNRTSAGGETNLTWGNGVGTAPDLTFNSWDGATFSEKMRIQSNGNVGIGTPAPNTIFDVAWTNASTITTNDSTVRVTNLDTTPGNYSSIRFSTIDTLGFPASPAGFGAVFVDHTNGALKGDLFFNTAGGLGTEKMRVRHDGNVGIGTSAPETGARFDVRGGAIAAGSQSSTLGGEVRFYESGGSNFAAFRAPTAIVSDLIWTLPASLGTAGQVLSTNAAGSLTWVTVSAGTGSNGFGTSSAVVATSETTGTSSWVDLTTAGPAVTVTSGTSALVTMTAELKANASAGTTCAVSFAVSGATTIAASTSQKLEVSNTAGFQHMSATYLVTGLNAGSNTFTLKYQAISPTTTCTFLNRNIIVSDPAGGGGGGGGGGS
ncbi:MAG: hypothetical protein V4760_06785, partial [Bdellovibrionota bacterium]